LNKEGRKRIAETFYKHAATKKNGGERSEEENGISKVL